MYFYWVVIEERIEPLILISWFKKKVLNIFLRESGHNTYPVAGAPIKLIVLYLL